MPACSRLLPPAALLAALAAACAPAPPAPSGSPDDGPALVALVVVDQLRADLLERYDAFFTGGLRRLLDEGAVYTGASHAHAATVTAVGHATLATGVYPARHGIVGNEWYEPAADGSLTRVYSVADTLSPIIGFPQREGRSSRNLERTGLADWVLAHDPRARSLSVSVKDRAAIALGGRGGEERAHVYWLDLPGGRFVTSTHYRRRYPAWVERFNRDRMPELLAGSVWMSGASEAARRAARPDSAPYERDGAHVTFPHVLADEVPAASQEQARTWLSETPYPDRALFAFVEAALDEFELGRRGATDYLAVSFSQTDYIGHAYGPLSQEQLSNLLSLDQVLGELLTLLDERVGVGRWVLGFSADHGVLTMPEYLAEHGTPARRLPGGFSRDVARLVQESKVEATSDREVLDELTRRLEALPFVADVLTPADLEAEPADSFVTLFRRSYRPDRRTGLVPRLGLQVRYTEHTLASSQSRRTSHGSPYWYDRSVPFVLLGAGRTPSRPAEAVHTIDMAPTLAAWAGVDFPKDLDGRNVGGDL